MKSLCERSDEELCGLAAKGDQQAEECLVTRYHRLVRSCARPYFLAGGDGEDLIQEGMIGLLSAVRGFVPEREALFRNYAETCIQNRLRSAVRAAVRKKHALLNSSVSLEATLFEAGPEAHGYSSENQQTDNPEDVLIGREERRGRMLALRSKLSAFEETVFDLYLDGLSYTEIAVQVGRSPKAVDNAVQRIRRKAAPFFLSATSA